MDAHEYLNRMKEVHGQLLEFIDESDIDFTNLKDTLEELKFEDTREDLFIILNIVARISENHYRYSNFFTKIETILLFYENSIKQTFSNLEIYNIFQNDPRILYFLIEKKILILDIQIFVKMKDNNKINFSYFYYQLKDFYSYRTSTDIFNKLSKNPETLDKFDEKCKIGENESYICQLIREDNVEEFVKFTNQTNISLLSRVKKSIFETNSFLISKNPTLIQYAAFFGAIQIVKYLQMNEVKLDSSLFLYSIHGRNAELIHFLEDNIESPSDSMYQEYLKEAIKCHHSNIANYIHDLFFKEDLLIKINVFNNFSEFSTDFAYRYFNFEYMPDDFDHEFTLIYLVQYNYYTLIKLLLQTKDVNINPNTTVIFKQKKFF